MNAPTTRQTLYDDDTFTYRGHTFKVTFPRAEDTGPPWEEHDGHGEVSDWTSREKRPGERVLVADRQSYRYYDFAATVRKARAEGWGIAHPAPGLRKRQLAALAVEADLEYCRRWANDDWEWIGVVVTLLDADGEPAGETEAVWGIESNSGAYLTETAYELVDEIMARVEVDEPQAVRGEN